jgi:hypothetical protein
VIGGVSSNQVENNSLGDVQIDPVAVGSVRPSDANIRLPDDRRPTGSLVFNVLDFGARADGGNAENATDNTAAFQRAMNTARAKGGGTVYVPGGSFRFSGNLIVPSGVELRGVFDVPHHTISWGSTLLPTAGRGAEDGTPFISLNANSGARGLTFYYPDQRADAIVSYPWTIRALGPRCWLIDVTSANSYQYVDFGSYPSNGSLLRFVSGAPLRRGIWVSNGAAEVDDGMFNPHYWTRRPADAPQFANGDADAAVGKMVDYVTDNLDAYTFGNCKGTQQVDNFVYGCKVGLRFVSDNGLASSGTVVNHGSDGSTEGLHIDAASADGLNLINTQLANVGEHSITSVEIAKSNTGLVNLYNGETWGKPGLPTMLLHGLGMTNIENWGTSLEEIHVSGGAVNMLGCSWSGDVGKQLVSDGRMRRLVAIGNTSGDEAFVSDKPSSTSKLFANGAFVRPLPLADVFHSGFEAADPMPAIAPLGVQGMTSNSCTVVAGAGRGGGHGLVLHGAPSDTTDHATAYYVIYGNLNLPVTDKTVLRYWIKPGTEMGTNTGVDLTFATGAPLRDSKGQDVNGEPSHPGARRGSIGVWRMIEIPLANQAGRVINQILFAFDSRTITGAVQSTIDDIEIGDTKESP